MESSATGPNQSDDIDDSGNMNSTNKRKSRAFSDVWNFFIRKGEGKNAFSECKGCKQVYKGGGKSHGTSTLRRHIEVCKKLKFKDVGQMIVDHDGKIRSRKVNHKIARELLASAVIKHDLPFSFVEYDGIRAFLKYVNPNLPCISRNTLVSDITKVYEKEKAKLKEGLGKLKHRICLTSDVWTACTSEGYICLTAHYVDENWKLNSKILNFDHFPPPHSGVELAAKVLEFLKEWNIDTKIFSLTLDNASSNDAMQNILKDQLSNNGNLVCSGEFFHIRCSAHVLNLIVQDGLKIGGGIGGPLSKVRESVKYVKSSEGRMNKFQECVKGIPDIDSSVSLRLDVVTRWNSTYLMLDSAIKYKKAFASLLMNDRTYYCCPTNEDWIKVEKLHEFLEPFYETTNLISGSSYPTSNLYFMQVWKIECWLKQNLLSEDTLISDMCKKMIEKFDKYWSEYSVVLSFGAVLDPRFKYQMLEFFYSEVESDPIKVQEKMILVKSKLYKLFESYNKTTTNSRNLSSSDLRSQSSSTPLFASNKSVMSRKFLEGMSAYENKTMTKAGNNQLDIYLEEPKLEYEHYQELNVLEFWMNQRHRFPDLASMACDILAIPITTVASESTFSIGGRILTKYRSSIIPENFQALICSRNWVHGFEFNDVVKADETHSKMPNPLEIDETLVEEQEDGDEYDHDDVMLDEF